MHCNLCCGGIVDIMPKNREIDERFVGCLQNNTSGDYPPFCTFTATRPFGPLSTSNFTFSPSFRGADNWLACTKMLSPDLASRIKPKPFVVLKKLTVPVRMGSSSSAWYLGTPISMSSALNVCLFEGSGGVDDRFPFSSI